MPNKINLKGEVFKKYFSNLSWLFVEKIFRLVFNFAVSVYVVRYLGPENNGVLAFSISVATILTAFSNLGLRGIFVRQIVDDEENTIKYLGTTFYLKLISSILLFLSVVIYYLLNPNVERLVLLFVSLSVIFQSMQIFEFFFQAKVESKFAVQSKFWGIALSNILKIWLILSAAKIEYFGIAYTVEFAVQGFVMLFYFKRNYSILPAWKYDFGIARSLLKDSWPLFFSAAASVIYLKVDKIILMELMSKATVGIYDSATRICESINFLPLIITTTLLPAIVKSKKMNREIYDGRSQKLYDLLTWIAYAVVIPIAVFSQEIIDLLYQSDFESAGSVLRIYIIASIPIFIYMGNSQFLITENLTKTYLYRAVLGMIANVGLNLYLIPIYGMMGAAYATLVSYSVAAFSVVLFPSSRNHFKMIVKSLFMVNLPKFVIGRIKNS
ncbi:MAG: flippase [Melioribacteraceae bacterium]|nr:flippase [Melioribacteraceae bacterium]MCF8263425.1 flippase [Melioribacteraceae bacterium]MCF8430423.1 flippase [Melioribacteraceae bacterium]